MPFLIFLYYNIDGILIDDASMKYKQLISTSSLINKSSICKIIMKRYKIELVIWMYLHLSSLLFCGQIILNQIMWNNTGSQHGWKQLPLLLHQDFKLQTDILMSFLLGLKIATMNLSTNTFWRIKSTTTPLYISICIAINTNVHVVVKILAVSADRPQNVLHFILLC